VNRADQAKWQTMPMLAFDVETTGVDVWSDRIVTACVVEFHEGQRPKSSTWLINPGIDIPAEAAEIHGITTEHAREHGQDPAAALFEVSGQLALWMGHGFPVVAYNAPYDFTMLEAENRRHGLPTLVERLDPLPIGPIIDPLVIDKHVEKFRKGKRQLPVTAKYYGVPLDNAHSADADAAAAVGVARAVLTKHARQFDGLTLGGLHQAQTLWRAEQMTSLRRHFDRQGTEHDGCDGSWPVLPVPAPPVAPDGSERQGALL
jgi:DNA polymerase-3 subunit epsilon